MDDAVSPPATSGLAFSRPYNAASSQGATSDKQYRNFAHPEPVRLALPLDGSSVAKGRAFLEQTVRGWGVGIDIDDAKLLLTELVTNALVHAGTAVQLQMRAEDGALVVAVVDEGEPLPHANLARLPHTALSMDGRGLAIVSSLANRWGFEVLPDGNRVWFELAYAPEDGAGPPKLS